jgi:hypothetical protein
MKGVIPQCLTEMVEKKFGGDRLEAVLKEARMPGRRFLAVEDTPDAEVMLLIQSACKVLSISSEAAAEAFGEYWCVDFAPRIYKAYYRNITGAKQFLMMMKKIHEQVTQNIPNAKPPVFDFQDTAPNKLVMKYSSPRHLESIWRGCIKGTGLAFKEKLSMVNLGPSAVEITFG